MPSSLRRGREGPGPSASEEVGEPSAGGRTRVVAVDVTQLDTGIRPELLCRRLKEERRSAGVVDHRGCTDLDRECAPARSPRGLPLTTSSMWT